MTIGDDYHVTAFALFVLPTPDPLFCRPKAAVQEGLRPLQLSLGIQLAQQHLPNPLPSSVGRLHTQASPAGRRRTIGTGHVLPRKAALQDEENAVERAAIIVPFSAWTSFLLGDEGLDNAPLLISNIMPAPAPSLA
jgi:hypothetical protein